MRDEKTTINPERCDMSHSPGDVFKRSDGSVSVVVNRRCERDSDGNIEKYYKIADEQGKTVTVEEEEIINRKLDNDIVETNKESDRRKARCLVSDYRRECPERSVDLLGGREL